MPTDTKVIMLLGGTYGSFQRELEHALRDVPAEHILSVSYSTSRIFGVLLQHHGVVVLRQS